jgi:hypothetical protein
MELAVTRRKLGAAFVVVLAAMTAVFSTAPAQGAKKGSCSPLDLAFVLDNTGSMGGAIDNIKKGLNKIVSEANTVSGGNVRYALVTFPEDNVVVNTPFADHNESQVKAAINSTFASGGGNIPESSDEALETAVLGRRATDVPPGKQTGDFQPPYRSGAQKIAVVITDAPPGGFDDDFTSADTAHAKQVAREARNRHVRVTSVWVGGTDDGDTQAKPALQTYAKTSGGEFRTTRSDGSGASAAIRASIATCGGKIKRRLRVKGTPHTIRAGRTSCVSFRVTSRGKPVKGARVRFAGHPAKTNRKGRATICVRLSRTGCRGVRATRRGFLAGRTRVCVAAAPRFTG